MTKVAIVTAVWQRFELTRLWWVGMDRVRRSWRDRGLDVVISVCGSQPEHSSMAADYDAIWSYGKNKWLSLKFNNAFEEAYATGADYFFITGSDDFYSPALVDHYADQMAAGVDYTGLPGIYFYDLDTQRLTVFLGYEDNHRSCGQSIGAGRLIHRSVIDRRGSRPWDDCRKRALDANLCRRLRLDPGHLIQLDRTRVALDVKTPRGNVQSQQRIGQIHSLEDANDWEVEYIPEWPSIKSLTGVLV